MRLSLTPAFARTAPSSLCRARQPVALGFHTTPVASRAQVLKRGKIHTNTTSPLSSSSSSSSLRKPLPSSKSLFTSSAPAQLPSSQPQQTQLDPQTQPDHRIDEILDFWFSLPPGSWFGAPSAAFPTPASLDGAIKARFEDTMDSARAGRLDETWTQTPKGTLALLLLLDQFPRHVYRGTGTAFASDAHAVSVAARGIAKGFDKAFGAADKEVTRKSQEKNNNNNSSSSSSNTVGGRDDHSSLIHRVFFYLPLSHAEDPVTQVAAAALSENLLLACPAEAFEGPFLEMSLHIFRRHRDVILRLGRFPARNEALGRQSTDEEVAFLKEKPEGW
ncbi:hypothetical protein F5B21DRAFT_164940 [Xylaria acuta]|nr:hypothetical protein F5B21DRAFT_164940 [Xylaria acuta]